MIFKKNKKNISAVVATALLLIVAIVAVIGFQTWNSTYLSNILINSEKSSINLNSVSIEEVIDESLYIKSKKKFNSTLSVLINNNECLTDVKLKEGINKINIKECLTTEKISGTIDVSIISEDLFLTKKIFFKETVIDTVYLIWQEILNDETDAFIALKNAVDETGLYTFGSLYNSGNLLRLEKRNINTGEVIWANNSIEGKISYSFTHLDIEIDSNNIYTLKNLNTSRWVLSKRNKDNGQIIWNITSSNLTSSAAMGISIDENYIYVSGISELNQLLEKRYKTNGSLIWTLNSNLKIIPSGIINDENAIYLFGSNSSLNAIIQKFNKNNGSLIWENINEINSTQIYSCAVDKNYLYVGGNFWYTQKFDKKNGSIIWSLYNMSGNDTISTSSLYSVIENNDYLYYYGTARTINSSYISILQKRLKTNGSLVWSKTLYNFEGTYSGFTFKLPAQLTYYNGEFYVAEQDILTKPTETNWIVQKWG